MILLKIIKGAVSQSMREYNGRENQQKLNEKRSTKSLTDLVSGCQR